VPPLGTWGAPTIYLVPPGYTMSALPPKADMDQHGRDVRFVPKAISTYLNAPEGAVYGFAPSPPSGPIWKGLQQSPNTPIRRLYLASSYAGSGGFTGAILAGAATADQVLLEHRATAKRPS